MNIPKRVKVYVATLWLSTFAFAQSEYTTCLYDSMRQRPIPIAVYQPAKMNKRTPVIIFSHGYGANDSNSYKAYSSLTRPLSEKGYYVISIQHELPTDPFLAVKGNFMETRMPNWKRGVENILFTINEFKKLKPELDWNQISLLGHSNGGDMTMLFATLHPQLIQKAISLDHRRMRMPRILKPRLYSLRGCDYEADKGVIPTVKEQKEYHISVIQLDGITHSEMDNKGSQEKHEQMLQFIYHFLKH